MAIINQEYKEYPRIMHRIETKIIKVGLRLAQKPVNSVTLIAMSMLFNILVVLLILSPANLGQPLPSTNGLVSVLITVRTFLFYSFLENMELVVEHIILIGLVSLAQVVFIYLACKSAISERERSLLKTIYFLKVTFSLPILANLLCVFHYLNDSKYIFLKVVSCLYILVSTISEYLCEKLNFTCLYMTLRKKDQAYDFLGPSVKLLVKVLVIYVVSKITITKEQKIVICIILLLTHVCQIWNLLMTRILKFNPFLQMLNYLGWLLVACYNLISLLQISIKLVQDNKWLVLLSLFAWSSLAYHSVIEYSKGMFLIQSPEHIHNEAEAVTYIRLLHNVFENRQETSNSILLLGLIKDHSGTCLNAECVCRARAKAINSSMIKDSDFFLEFIEANIRTLRTRFDTYNVDIACLAFQVEVMKKFPLYFYKADIFRKKSEHKGLYLHENYAMHQIEKVALKQVNQQKSSDFQISNEKSLDLLKSQKNIEECYIKLQKMVLHFSNFYKYNFRTFCGLDLLKKELDEIYAIMVDVIKIFGQKKIQDHLSSELIYLLLLFYQSIFNLAFKSKPIVAQLEKLYKRVELKEISQQNFDISLFSQNGCVIQSTLESNVFGLISKTSTNTHHIFRYPSVESMVNLDIHRLLPRCCRESHLQMVKRWLETGSFKKINKLHETFCYDYEQNLFRALMRSQIAIIDDKISVFVGLIKLDSENYMVLNKKGQIDSYGTEFGKIANQSRHKNIEELLPSWKAISQDLTRDPVAIKTKLIQHPRRQENKNPKAMRVLLQNSLNPEVQQYHITLQAYRSSMGLQQFTVVRKMGYARIETENKLGISSSFASNPCFDEECVGDMNGNKSSRFATTNIKNMNVGIEISSISSTSKDSFYSVWRMLEQVYVKATNPSLNYPLLNYITIILFVLFIGVIATMGCQFVLQTRGLQSFNEVIYADSAVSDNMQLMEIIYNSILMMGQHCGYDYNAAKCQEMRQYLGGIQDIFDDLLAKHIEDAIKNVTFLGHHYFEYELAEVNVTLNGTVVSIGTFQFMEYFSRHSKHLLTSLKQHDQTVDYVSSINNLKANWNQLKRINYQNLKYYQAIGIVQLDTCILFAITLSTVYGVLVTLYALAQLYLVQHEQSFANKILILFRRISIKISEELVTHYEQIAVILNNRDHSEFSKAEMPRISQTEGLVLHGYSPYKNIQSKVCLCVYWFVFLAFITVSTFKISEYNGLEKNSILTLNNLMMSQNYLFEAYFEMKAIYMYSNFTQRDVEAYYDQVLSKLGHEENDFVKTALLVSDLVADQDKSLADQFSELVIKNVCEATMDLLTDPEYQKCKSAMNLQMLEQGILISITFFQNIIFETAEKLKKKQNIDFSSKEHEDMDRYLLYMLRLYQLTQSRMISILNDTMSQRMQLTTLLFFAQVAIQCCCIVYWCWRIPAKRRALAKRYGYLLVLPVTLIKESKLLQQHLGQLL